MHLLTVQNRITELFSIFVARVKMASSTGRTDVHHVSETVLIPILSRIFNLPNLVNLNDKESENFPGIDLGDESAAIAFQITASSDSEKIKHTLRQFVKHEHYNKYKRLRIYILTAKQESYSGSGYDQIIQGLFQFDKDIDIIDSRDILKIIMSWQLDEALAVLQIMEANFGRSVPSLGASPTIYSVDSILELIPEPLQDEITRDSILRQVTSRFSPSESVQVIVGPTQVGKTVFLSQFARRHNGRAISYFISSDPFSQLQEKCLENFCIQLSVILGLPLPPPIQTTAQWQSVFNSLWTRLILKIREERQPYYFVIDGLEWALSGNEGSRIIDLVRQIGNKPKGVYLLYSCRADMYDSLPSYVKGRDIELPTFSELETKAFFTEVDFPEEEIIHIHHKCDGTPGYLRIIKDTKLTHPNDPISITGDLANLVEQQISLSQANATESTKAALELIAAAPAPLKSSVLAHALSVPEEIILEGLQRSRLVKINTQSGRIDFVNEFLQSKFRDLVQNKKAELLAQLIDSINVIHPDDPILELLYIEAEDYNGLKNKLVPIEVLSTIRNTEGVSRILARLKMASAMASSTNDFAGLVKYTLGVATAKSLIDHVVDQGEVMALIAVGEDDSAFRKINAMPDLSGKIRLLAQAYRIMRERGVRITPTAREELTTLVRKLPMEELGRDVIHDVALDVLWILPDVGIELLEKLQKGEETDPIGTIINSTNSGTPESGLVTKPLRVGDEILSLENWRLPKKPLAAILDDLQPSTTKAQEFIIRKWCRQFKKHRDIEDAVNLWLDTITGDTGFVIKLKSLRQICEVVAELDGDIRSRLLPRLAVIHLGSLQVPMGEWVRVKLALAKAKYPASSADALQEIDTLYNELLSRVFDYDERAYCLARIWLTLSLMMPNDTKKINQVSEQFEHAFNNLRENAAEHFDVLRPTLATLAKIDPEYALLIASELNIRERRSAAFQVVLWEVITTRGESDISSTIRDALSAIKDIDHVSFEAVLRHICKKSRADALPLIKANIDEMRSQAEFVLDATSKSEILANIAALYSEKMPEECAAITDEVIEVWKRETDLKQRMNSGYLSVRVLAKFNLEKAKELFSEVQKLQLQPGANLASGSLGATFADVIRILIRTYSISDFSRDNDEVLVQFDRFVKSLPSVYLQIELYARLAYRAYALGATRFGDEVTRKRLVNWINEMEESYERTLCIEEAFPVIYEYDPEEAQRLANILPVRIRNNAWYRACFMLMSFDYDLLIPRDVKTVRFALDRPRIQKAINCLKGVEYDNVIYSMTALITTTIINSFEQNKIDVVQASEALARIEELTLGSGKLPDQQNIKHNGYIVLVDAAIHAVRSVIFEQGKYRKNLTRKDIDSKWRSIISEAKDIPNVADRVLVLALVARDYSQYSGGNTPNTNALLKEAYEQIPDIVTLHDRINRLEFVIENWLMLGNMEQVKMALLTITDMLQGLESDDKDTYLESVIKLGYEVNEEFAEELISQLDPRLPKLGREVADDVANIKRLVENPAYIAEKFDPKLTPEDVLNNAIRRLKIDKVAGRGGLVPHNETIANWLLCSQYFSPYTVISVVEWAIDNFKHKVGRTNQYVEAVAEILDLIYLLATETASPSMNVIADISQYGFNSPTSNVVSFEKGDTDRARAWLGKWFSEDTRRHVKICDPLFSVNELSFLLSIPLDCKVFIVTTDKYWDVSIGQETIRQQVLATSTL